MAIKYLKVPEGEYEALQKLVTELSHELAARNLYISSLEQERDSLKADLLESWKNAADAVQQTEGDV